MHLERICILDYAFHKTSLFDMKTLSINWFTEGLIDFEYKKYILLSYLKEINQQFNRNKLYPEFGDLVFHYNNLLAFKSKKETLKNNFPTKLSPESFEKLKAIYEKIIEDDGLMTEIETIIQYSISKMNTTLHEGKEIYEFVESRFSIYPIGLIPIYPAEGYMFLLDGKKTETKVYEYRVTIFENTSEKYRGINTQYIQSYDRNFINTPENIKLDLIRNRKVLPNPAVYGIETDLTFPLTETILPIAKRCLVRHLATSV